jgi:hypothetical protein
VLNGEEITWKLFEPHLREKTPQTELWLSLMNWKKDHPTEDIKQLYLKYALIHDQRLHNNHKQFLVESLISNLPKSPKDLCKKSIKTNTKEL